MVPVLAKLSFRSILPLKKFIKEIELMYYLFAFHDGI
jgi:hypothetical protein